MQVCLIMDNPETTHHPVIASALEKLSAIHHVRLLDVRSLTDAEALAEEQRQPMADLYLLKSHTQQALSVAHALEQRGAPVINNWASTLACRDRLLMTQRMEQASLPWPRTCSLSALADLFEQRERVEHFSFPLMVKSRYSRRGDLVTRVNSVEQLLSHAQQWSQEPVILQEFLEGDGWDMKLWVIGEQVFAARRRTPLEENAEKIDYPLPAHALPGEWKQIALAVGEAFNLRLYGLDLLITDRGPVIVDVNSFPGFRGVQGADDALVALVEQLIKEKLVHA